MQSLIHRSLDSGNQCINSPTLAVFFPSVIANIISDLMSTGPLFRFLHFHPVEIKNLQIVFILPFFLLRYIRISSPQFWGLISIFGLGALAILMSIARIIALAVSATTTQVAVWTALECSIGIIVACCPALRVLLRRPGESVQESMGSQAEVLRARTERNEVVGFPLVDMTRIYKSVEFEIGSDRGSESGSQMRRNTLYNGRLENWQTAGGKGMI